MTRYRDEAVGEDSFLDIVANLVGILIILVVVVGAQAATVWQNPDSDVDQAASSVDDLKSNLKLRSLESDNLQAENAELHRKLEYEKRISEKLEENRRQMLLAIEFSNRELKAKRIELSDEQQASHQTAANIEELKHEVQQVRYEFAALDLQTNSAVETIEHYPTPIAKTVFSDEIHFQILADRIVHVPLNELVDAMKNEWQVKAKQLANAENTWESVGPIGDFRLKYLLTVVAKQNGPRSQYGVQFQRFVLQPANHDVGEPIGTATNAGSNFRAHIDRMVPQKTTVSLWVYPDSYEELTYVRKWLRNAGFQTASWPLNFGQPISGGPNGFRTTTN